MQLVCDGLCPSLTDFFVCPSARIRGLSRLLRDDLHWLTIPQRVQYELVVSVHRYLRYGAPMYLADCCVPVSEVSGRQHLRSTSRRKLNIPRFRRNTVYGHFGPKTLRTQDISALVPICPRDTSAPVPKCLGHLGPNRLLGF